MTTAFAGSPPNMQRLFNACAKFHSCDPLLVVVVGKSVCIWRGGCGEQELPVGSTTVTSSCFNSLLQANFDAGERKIVVKMSEGNWRPNDGHGPDMGDGPSSSSRSVPIYVLFLIMLASGIFTLVFLWICVQCFYHKRRMRRSRADIERNAAAQRPWQAEAPADGALAKDLEADAKRCDASEVELTYVVMAGEEQPTFLAKPLRNTNSEEEKPSVSSPTKLDERDEALVAAKPGKTSAS